ncbi:hypothetical protein SAMN06265367_1061 [Algoriphagus winogradskyi]|uniref:Lipoprotein n=2 Tax=Algoriphagus winogradskyi TaxID=237017 RepID=A0ABY1PAB9_9BACT|nr:hypothetical protein SAMN06265367_1061 [Algoriphagus winogradskyi]
MICFLLLDCTDNVQQEKTKQAVDINSISNDTLKIEKPVKPKIKKFDINRFQLEADSLLKVLKDEKYSLELKSDTFNFKTDNPEIFTKGHGIFWLLYQDSSERIVRHYLFEPNTKKKLRIYIVEVNYNKKEQLEQVVTKLETSMNDSINAPDSDDFTRWRLSPTNDYVMTSDNKLYWMNMSYSYSNNEVLKFIDRLKSNVDTTKFKGRIICLFGSNCKNKNVP